jgi:hypothetical protein
MIWLLTVFGSTLMRLLMLSPGPSRRRRQVRVEGIPSQRPVGERHTGRRGFR